jgi:hypothetical protein
MNRFLQNGQLVMTFFNKGKGSVGTNRQCFDPTQPSGASQYQQLLGYTLVLQSGGCRMTSTATRTTGNNSTRTSQILRRTVERIGMLPFKDRATG